MYINPKQNILYFLMQSVNSAWTRLFYGDCGSYFVQAYPWHHILIQNSHCLENNVVIWGSPLDIWALAGLFAPMAGSKSYKKSFKLVLSFSNINTHHLHRFDWHSSIDSACWPFKSHSYVWTFNNALLIITCYFVDVKQLELTVSPCTLPVYIIDVYVRNIKSLIIATYCF